jgi:hypothetical protein
MAQISGNGVELEDGTKLWIENGVAKSSYDSPHSRTTEPDDLILKAADEMGDAIRVAEFLKQWIAKRG